MRKFVQSRRGLSSVVTTAIMLTAVAVIGSAIVSWSNGNLKAFETNLASTSSDQTNKINENLLIENVAFCHTNHCPITNNINGINITLTNVGYIGLNVTQIQINGSYSWKVSPPISLNPHTSSLYQNILPWNSKSLDTITVTTARGTIITTQVVAP